MKESKTSTRIAEVVGQYPSLKIEYLRASLGRDVQKDFVDIQFEL